MKRLCFLLLATAAIPLAAQEPARPASPAGATVPKIAFEKYVLPNGLQVILHVDRKLPVVHVNQWFHVGSKNERAGRSGFAHLFEHMMFQGSKNASKEYFSYAEAAGANLREGGVNGTTDQDRTNYFATVPSGNLENLLWVESDRLGTLPEALTPEKLDNQREVVKNERRQGLENTPYGRWFKLVAENLYPHRHPYANDVIGEHEDLTAATLDDVREFFRTYYTPNNLSIVIAGDFDPAQAKPLVEKYFGTIPSGPPLDRHAKGMPRLDGERIVEVADRVPQERTYFAWHAPAYFDAGDAELNLVATILTDGLSARLNRALIYDRPLASNAVAFASVQPLTGSFIMWVTARPGTDLATIEGVVTDEIARLAKEGPTEEELARAKTKWEFNFVTGLERIGGFGGKADILNQYNTYLGNPDMIGADFARYRQATTTSVREAVDGYLNTRNRLLVRFRPEQSGRPSAVTVERTTEPPLGGDKPFNAPEVKTAKLDNGFELFVVERQDLPKVSVTLASRAGSVSDPEGKGGLASMTARVVRRGTAARGALEIDSAMGDLGTTLGWSVGRENARLHVDVLKRNLSPALSILADVALNPAFPGDEFEREKKLALDALAQQANTPAAVAGRVAFMLAFGLEHPYGRPPVGLPGTVAGLTREDLVNFRQANWKPGSSALVFAGDITLAEATELARKAFGGWSGGAAAPVAIPAPRPVEPGKVFLIDRQNAAQTVVAHVLPAPSRTADDYYALILADAVYGGGGFGTRLNLNLREDKGYSYGVFSNAALLTHGGTIIASGGVQTDKTRESVVEFMTELKNFAGAKPISETELSAARLTRIRGYAQQFESVGRVADQVLALWTVGLPMAELQREPESLLGASLGSVNAAAAKYAVEAGTSLLLVGDLSQIEKDVRELGLGDVVVLDVEGRPAGGK
ncbi:pitrilysin family protein [soil metagenome]